MWVSEGQPWQLHSNEWQGEDELVLYRGKVYVSLDGQLWHDIVKAHHDSPVTLATLANGKQQNLSPTTSGAREQSLYGKVS